MKTAMDRKELHDTLLALMPADADHDAAQCEECAQDLRETREVAANDDDPEGGQVTDKTFTQEQLDAAVSEAVAKASAGLQAQLEELQAKNTQAALDEAVAAAVAERDAKVTELSNQVDVLTAERDKARQDLQEQTDFLVAAKAEIDQKAEADARKDDRIAKVKEAVPTFTKEKIDERADEWAAMDEPAFDKFLTDLREAAGANTGEPPSTTGLDTTRETAAAAGGNTELADVVGARIHRPAVSRLA